MKVKDLFDKAMSSMRHSAEFHELIKQVRLDDELLNADTVVSSLSLRVDGPSGQQRFGRFLRSYSGHETVNERLVRMCTPLHPDFADEDSCVYDEVSGVDIRNAYHWTKTVESGSIGESCMRHNHCRGYFGIYEQNSQVRLAVLAKPDGMIAARSLLWDGKLSDRVYSATSLHADLMEKHLTNRGYLNAFRSETSAIIKLDKTDFELYPFMDTFCFIGDGFVSNRNLNIGVHGKARATRGHIEQIGSRCAGCHQVFLHSAMMVDARSAWYCRNCAEAKSIGFCEECGCCDKVSETVSGRACSECIADFVTLEELRKIGPVKFSKEFRKKFSGGKKFPKRILAFDMISGRIVDASESESDNLLVYSNE